MRLGLPTLACTIALLFAGQAAASVPRLDGTLSAMVSAGSDRSVTVEVLTRPGARRVAARRVRAEGGTTPSVARGIIEARVPVEALGSLSRDPSVRFIRK